MALGWLAKSRRWAQDASARAGVGPPLSLLPSAPVLVNDAWRRVPSFSAAAALLVPPVDGWAAAVSSSSAGSELHAWSPADARAAADVAASAAWLSRALWLAGSRDLFFALTTPYDHVRGLEHRKHQLLPLVARLMAQASSGSGNEADERRRASQAAAVFNEIAADQRPGGLRLLGWLLSHLFRWLFNSEVYVDVASIARLRALYNRDQPQPQPGDSSGVSAPAPGPRACLVYIPAHKSHIDYLGLSYVLFGCGLPCPHIAAGANLSLPLVGRLLRSCGAFFIRRAQPQSPDRQYAVYKAVLAAYVHSLLMAGHSLEFFIEGGRSRDGRVNAPKLGMLRMVVDAVAAGDVGRPVYLVPTAMNYDALLEERSMAAQLAGAPKQSESLMGLISTCWGIVSKAVRLSWKRRALGLGAGGYCGRATVAFGEPISLQQWLQDHGDELEAGGAAQRRAVAALGDLVIAGIRTTSVLPTSALLVGALFAKQRSGVPPAAASTIERALQNGGMCAPGVAGTAVPEIAARMDWLASQLEARGAAVVRLPLEAGTGQQQQQLLHLASMLPSCCSLAPATSSSSGSSGADQAAALQLERGVEATLLQHSRLNQYLPWFAAEGLLAASVLAAARQGGQPGVSSVELLDSATFLRCLLGPEIDTALGLDALRTAHQFEAALQRLLDSSALVQQLPGDRLQLADPSSSAGAAALFASALLAPLLATYLEALRAMGAALAGAGPAGMTTKALCSVAQTHLLQLTSGSLGDDASSSRGDIASLVVPSVALVQGALKSFAALGVLAAVQGTTSTHGMSGLALQQSVSPPRQRVSNAPAPNGGASSVRPHRRSLERRRTPAQQGSSSRSGSDSEQDPAPIADSVAADLCALDSGGLSIGCSGSSSPPAQCGAAPVVLAASSSGQQRWALAQSDAVASLIDRIEFFICI